MERRSLLPPNTAPSSRSVAAAVAKRRADIKMKLAGASFVALVVADQDEAIAFFTQRLGFALVEDTPVGPGKRWVTVRPPGGGASLLLAKAATPEQAKRVGDQAGGRVFLFLQTDDFGRNYAAFRDRGVRFAEEPREPYGTVAVFLDLYGNRWDLVQPRSAGSEPDA